MSLIFHTNPMSRGRIVRWMLEETGAAYETCYRRDGPEMNTDDYAAINPMRKVPAIVHDGKVVTECAAICPDLADALPQADLAPRPDDRATCYRGMLFGAGPWEQTSTNQSLGLTVTPEKSRIVGCGDFERTLDAVLGAVPKDGFLLGEKFTALDVYLGSRIGWGAQFGQVPKTPEVEAYVSRIQSRRGYIRANEADEAAGAEFGPGG